MSQSVPEPLFAKSPSPARRGTPSRVTWRIAPSGPALDPKEVETTDAAVEVVVMWGPESVLHVEHVSPPRDVFIGESPDCDYTIGADVLGAARLPVVVEREGQIYGVLPRGAEADQEQDGERTTVDTSTLQPFDELDGALLAPIPEGGSVWVRHRGLTFLLRSTRAGQVVTGSRPRPGRRHLWLGVSFAVHAAILLAFYFLPPSSRALSLNQITAEDRLVQYIDAAHATEQEEQPEWVEPGDRADASEGQRVAGEEGAAGDETAPDRERRYAVRQRDESERRLAHEELAENMEQVTTISVVSAVMGTWASPTSPFGATSPNGYDETDAIGRLLAADVGSASGRHGLSMRGSGLGAGGTAQGTIGLGHLNTLGSTGTGEPGYGRTVGGLRPQRDNRVPPPFMGTPVIMGSMSRETIRRVVRRHLSEVRFCYEQGLQQNPSIEGRVTVRWIIAPTGSVQNADVMSSSLANGQVEGCISQAVRRWSFPMPDGGGVVGVNYPFVLRSSH